jgi:hypothetical protein
VALSFALLTAVDGFDGGVDVDPDPRVAQTSQQPNALWQNSADARE